MLQRGKAMFRSLPIEQCKMQIRRCSFGHRDHAGAEICAKKSDKPLFYCI
jgi:hypothetical protein